MECTSMDPNTHVHGQTHMYTFAENSSEDKRATPAGLKGKHSKVPRDCKPYAPQLVREHTHGHALLERERDEMCAHDRTYWRRCPAIREADRHRVSGSNRLSPENQENQSVTGSIVSGEKDERWPGLRKVHLLTLPHTAMQYSSVSKLFRLPPHPP